MASVGFEITPALKKQFIDSMATHLDNFEKMLLALEKDPRDSEAIHSAFRAVHSIKGDSDYMGIGDINTLTHSLETLMDEIRQGEIAIEDASLAMLFGGLDLLRDMNRGIADEGYVEMDISSILAEIERILAAGRKEAAPPTRRSPRIDVRSLFVRSSVQHMDYVRETASTIVA